jgi:hypothetical protein
VRALSNAGFTIFDTQSRGDGPIKKFQKDFDVDSSKSEQRDKSPSKNKIEPKA